VFAKADGVKPGSRAILERKALTLTGGPTSPGPPEGRSVYTHVIQARLADVFLAYCTGARAAAREVPGLQVVRALKLAMLILSSEGHEILARHGFTAPTRHETAKRRIHQALRR
jgi:molybdate transport system substrate-binding protein